MTPTRLGSFNKSPMICFSESIRFFGLKPCRKAASLHTLACAILCPSKQQGRCPKISYQAQRAKSICEIGFLLGELQMAKLLWGQKQTEGLSAKILREGENPRKGDSPVSITSKLHERQGMHHCTQTQRSTGKDGLMSLIP